MWNLEKMVQMNLFAERGKDTNVVNGCWTGRWGRRWDASGLGLTYRHSPGCAHARSCPTLCNPVDWITMQWQGGGGWARIPVGGDIWAGSQRLGRGCIRKIKGTDRTKVWRRAYTAWVWGTPCWLMVGEEHEGSLTRDKIAAEESMTVLGQFCKQGSCFINRVTWNCPYVHLINWQYQGFPWWLRLCASTAGAQLWVLAGEVPQPMRYGQEKIYKERKKIMSNSSSVSCSVVSDSLRPHGL